MKNASQTDILILKEGTSSKNYAVLNDKERKEVAQNIADRVKENAVEKGITIHFSEDGYIQTLQPVTTPL